MALLALDQRFESAGQVARYYRYPGELVALPGDQILRDCSLLIAPNGPVMRNLAPRLSHTTNGPIGDPVLHQTGRLRDSTGRWGPGLLGGTTVISTHSSWAGIDHPKTTGFTLFAAMAMASGVSTGTSFALYFTGLGGDQISLGVTRYAAQYTSKVNWSGPAFSSSGASPPYFDNSTRGNLVVAVARTASANDHQVDAWSPLEGIYQSATDATNIPGQMDDTTKVTVGYDAGGAGRAATLYAGYWNRRLTDQETARLLFRPMTLFRRP